MQGHWPFLVPASRLYLLFVDCLHPAQPTDPAGVGILRRQLRPLVSSPFPGAPLRDGYHRNLMAVSRLAFCSAAICCLAWIVYIPPGSGSSEDMCLMASVTLSGVDACVGCCVRGLDTIRFR